MYSKWVRSLNETSSWLMDIYTKASFLVTSTAYPAETLIQPLKVSKVLKKTSVSGSFWVLLNFN